jgi:hypothetical protein
MSHWFALVLATIVCGILPFISFFNVIHKDGNDSSVGVMFIVTFLSGVVSAVTSLLATIGIVAALIQFIASQVH